METYIKEKLGAISPRIKAEELLMVSEEIVRLEECSDKVTRTKLVEATGLSYSKLVKRVQLLQDLGLVRVRGRASGKKRPYFMYIDGKSVGSEDRLDALKDKLLELIAVVDSLEGVTFSEKCHDMIEKTRFAVENKVGYGSINWYNCIIVEVNPLIEIEFEPIRHGTNPDKIEATNLMADFVGVPDKVDIEMNDDSTKYGAET